MAVERALHSKPRLTLGLGCLLGLVATAAGCGEGRQAHLGTSQARLFLEGYRPGERGASLTLIDLPAGSKKTVHHPQVGLGDPPLLDVTGGRLVFHGADGATYAIDTDLEGRRQKLANGWFFGSATEGRVWLTFFSRRSPGTSRTPVSESEVTVHGRVTVPRGAPPPCEGPQDVVTATAHAILCQSHTGLDVFDPRTGRVLMRLPGPFPAATYGNRVAWCGNACPRLHITDVATGQDQRIQPHGSFRFAGTYDGAFSPDGSLLAVPVNVRACPGHSDLQTCRIALVNVDSGTADLIRSPDLSVYAPLAWSSRGELYFLAARGRIMGYRPGAARAVALPVRVRKLNVLDMGAS